MPESALDTKADHESLKVLRYTLANALDQEKLPAVGGRAVIQLDEQAIARFARLDDGSDLADNERYLALQKSKGRQIRDRKLLLSGGKRRRLRRGSLCKVTP